VDSAPKITIITPSFNQASYLEQTILSVLEQGYPNLEYIVIDGGSTDGSADLLRKFDSRLAYWVSEKDRGQAHAINKGLERATGDIIAYLNSDDYYLDGTLERVANFFSRCPDVDLVHGRCRVVDENGLKIGQRTGSITRYDEILDLWDVWWNKQNFVQPEVFWTKRIARKIGPFREDLYWVMDYEYWVRVLREGGKVGFIDAELAAFRVQPMQKSTQPARTAEELLKVIYPHISGENVSLGRLKQAQLKAKWTYHTMFLKEVELSRLHDEARWRRLLRLGRFSLRHPNLFIVRSFRERLFNSLRVGKVG
jgi:glycosyltransferase involved in cell wall biosynthesis